MTKPESMIQYVVRKLKSKSYNRAEVARGTGILPSTLSEIANGKTPDPLHSTVQKINDYFNKLEG